MTTEESLTAADIRRLRRSYRLTRLVAAVVTAGCILLALVLAGGAWVALSLAEWGTLVLALAGTALLGGAAGFTLHLTRRQGRILEAAETLLRLTHPDESAP